MGETSFIWAVKNDMNSLAHYNISHVRTQKNFLDTIAPRILYARRRSSSDQ
jgi:hypothetical protein